MPLGIHIAHYGDPIPGARMIGDVSVGALGKEIVFSNRL